jgi:hypothetical protein
MDATTQSELGMGQGSRVWVCGAYTFPACGTSLIIFSPSKSVNLGGLFVLEPFITPSLFQRYPSAVDEWTLSLLMAADTANGGIDQIEEHYKTFIVRDWCFHDC